jgi:imidazole glycerol-phosphate synthase subunit HisH
LKTTLIDSPVANVANIARALRVCGADLELTRDPNVVREAKQIVLPGVGSFGAAMAWIESMRIDIALRQAVANGAWLLGICVGHQLLFESSDELGVARGLGLLRGDVRKLDGPLPIPQIGWNRVRWSWGTDSFYFVNSYAARNVPSEIATADYGGSFTAAARQGRVFGVQFHPEKSSTAGLRVLRNFLACN